MNYTYKFADGTTKEIEISEIFMAEINELERVEYNNNHRETRRHVSLESFNLDDGLFASHVDIEAETENKERYALLHAAIKRLPPKQRHLIYSIYFQGISIKEYAKRQDVTHFAIYKRLNTIYEKLKNFNK